MITAVFCLRSEGSGLGPLTLQDLEDWRSGSYVIIIEGTPSHWMDEMIKEMGERCSPLSPTYFVIDIICMGVCVCSQLITPFHPDQRNSLRILHHPRVAKNWIHVQIDKDD